MQQRCRGCEPLFRATLPDHQVVFRSVADILPMPGKVVEGALYRITTDHLWILDRCKGYPDFSTRREVTVISELGELVVANIYKLNSPVGFAPPFQAYLQLVLDGCRQWNMPETCIQKVIGAAAASYFGEY